MSTRDSASANTAPGRLPATVSVEPMDTHRRMTILSLVGLAAAGLLAVVGVPPVDLHGPLHHLGIMDPLCGGTRAAFLLARGDWAGAWTYNPIVFPLAAAALLTLVRTTVGVLTGRWLAVHLPRRRTIVVLLVIALAVLEVRQQLHAELLTADWTGPRGPF